MEDARILALGGDECSRELEQILSKSGLQSGARGKVKGSLDSCIIHGGSEQTLCGNLLSSYLNVSKIIVKCN